MAPIVGHTDARENPMVDVLLDGRIYCRGFLRPHRNAERDKRYQSQNDDRQLGVGSTRSLHSLNLLSSIGLFHWPFTVASIDTAAEPLQPVEAYTRVLKFNVSGK